MARSRDLILWLHKPGQYQSGHQNAMLPRTLKQQRYKPGIAI